MPFFGEVISDLVFVADFGFEILVFFAGEDFDFALALTIFGFVKAVFLETDLALGLEGEAFATVLFGGILSYQVQKK